MCRMVVFLGTCTRCNEKNTWDDLTQQLACLKAKNKGAYGQCSAGVSVEEHAHDQECDRCVEEDEGIADLDDRATVGVEKGKKAGKRGVDDVTAPERKKQRI